MAGLNLRKVDTQATVSIVLSMSSLFFVAGLAVLVFRNVDWETLSILYKSGTLRLPLIGVCGLGALGLSAIGFGFGISSAGERRNQKSHLSWLGFFVGAFSICVTIILLATFFFWKETVITG